MSITLYEQSIPFLKEVLASLTSVLQKGASSAKATALVESRIVDDMKPLPFQVYCVTDLTSKAAARLQGKEPTAYADDMKTFDDFFGRIKEVEAQLDAADKDLINSRAETNIVMGIGGGKTLELPAKGYVAAYIIPNTMFHLMTAYNILRKEGIELGKLDFLGAFMGKFSKA
ncbi:hypothetical protein B0I35DRAFT_447900 [Stachybotrys elegans]|uniref:DUF1993 domain-containing protein n=1 Tax=Stachybotrys elegans TaxID=80388 RepID=A0A8K0WVK9_9HYPO|nr:hypothetical protein B0I35DRAFT_447900 [Stachybotrys elegans]